MVPHNKNLQDCSVPEIVDCISSGIYGDAPLTLVSLLNEQPRNPYYDFLRISCVPYLFHEAEKIFADNQDPIAEFIRVLKNLTDQLDRMLHQRSFHEFFSLATETQNFSILNATDIAQATGIHYGNLFKEFTIDQYLEAKKLLATRLERNSITLDNLSNSVLLDQGCGGGRYTIAWKLLGAKKTTGIDISEIGISDAKRKLAALELKDIEFKVGSVLDLPFKDEQFDIVYSNGVLHHTNDWIQGIKEQVRVLKQGGFGWQYLIENPGGIFWDKIEILRAILKSVDKTYAQKVLGMYGVPNNRIFYMLDHVMVPINTRVTPDELRSALETAGAINIKRLDRGTDFDRVEMIHRRTPYAREKFGVGENRFVFSK